MVAIAQRPRKALAIELDPVIGHILRGKREYPPLNRFIPLSKRRRQKHLGQ
jgi:hypothetical protein